MPQDNEHGSKSRYEASIRHLFMRLLDTDFVIIVRTQDDAKKSHLHHVTPKTKPSPFRHHGTLRGRCHCGNVSCWHLAKRAPETSRDLLITNLGNEVEALGIGEGMGEALFYFLEQHI